MKLRTINVDNQSYLYGVGRSYIGNGNSTILVRIFVDKKRQYALIFEFTTWEDHTGSPLFSGIKLKNKKTGEDVKVNLNYPKYIRECILYGQKQGWTGDNKIPIQNGLDFLEDLGIDTNDIKPK